MFHFSTDRLAGLDTMTLKITTPPKVPTLIPNHTLHHTYGISVRKLKKQKPRRETRTPLADKTASNNLPHRPTSPMLLHSPSAAGEANPLPPSSPRVPCLPDHPSFRPLPPLPSASTLQLPSFLNFSTRSLASTASSRRVVVRKRRNSKVLEGPQWIPAFHHPNSPYVPWSPPVRRRILPSLSPVCPSSPCTRSGAIAPEPWASPTFSQVHNKSTTGRLSSSWKSFKDSIKKGVKTVVFHLGRSKASVGTLCINQDMLSIYDDANTTTVVQPSSTANPMRSTIAKAHSSDSLSSLVSSDSATLATWLAERRAAAACVIDDTPKEMSMEEYELIGSWLDLRRPDGGWVCGVQDCDMHTANGSPYAASEYPNGLRMSMPFDSVDLPSATHSSPGTPALAFPAGPFTAPPRFHSLPRLPCQSFDIHSTQDAKPDTLKNAQRCLARGRELSMPGGWTFN